MSPIPLDFGPESTSGTLPPEGEYEMICSSCEFVQAKSADKFPYLKWEFKISDGEFADKTFPISHITSLSPNSRYFLQQFLQALTQDSWDEDAMDFDPTDMPGHVAKAIIYHQPYTAKDGTEKMGLKISALLPAGDTGNDFKTFG